MIRMQDISLRLCLYLDKKEILKIETYKTALKNECIPLIQELRQDSLNIIRKF